MTLTVIFKAGKCPCGGNLVDFFEMSLSEFIRTAPDRGIDFEDIIKIEVV
jgi:hypothetical protein